MKIKYVLILFLALFFTGCEKKDSLITQKEVETYLKQGAVLIDVRTLNEYNEGHIANAISIPVDRIETVSYDKDQIIIVYCQSGNRSHMAKGKLENLGYTRVYDFGSIENWRD